MLPFHERDITVVIRYRPWWAVIIVVDVAPWAAGDGVAVLSRHVGAVGVVAVELHVAVFSAASTTADILLLQTVSLKENLPNLSVSSSLVSLRVMKP